MSLAPLASLPDAVAAIADFMMDHGRAMPDGVQAVLTALQPSPVDRVAMVAEALYSAAEGAALPEAVPTWTLCAQLAEFCTASQFYDIGQTPRGAGMAGKMRRLLGEPGATPTDQDPPPRLVAAPL